jgi:hypothetical protein
MLYCSGGGGGALDEDGGRDAELDEEEYDSAPKVTSHHRLENH